MLSVVIREKFTDTGFDSKGEVRIWRVKDKTTAKCPQNVALNVTLNATGAAAQPQSEF